MEEPHEMVALLEVRLDGVVRPSQGDHEHAAYGHSPRAVRPPAQGLWLPRGWEPTDHGHEYLLELAV